MVLQRKSAAYESIRREDLKDIACDKAVSLLNRIQHSKWSPAHEHPARIVRYLTSVARNGLIDHLRCRRVSSRVENYPIRNSHASSSSESLSTAWDLVHASDCLTEKARVIWFLRVGIGLTSKETASHPLVRSSPGAVDVALARARATIKNELAGTRALEPISHETYVEFAQLCASEVLRVVRNQKRPSASLGSKSNR